MSHRTCESIPARRTTRPKPDLQIKRRNVPSVFAFAITANAAQGQTLKIGDVVDLRLEGSSSSMRSYVALTRVVCRAVFIMDLSFPRDALCQERPVASDLMLQVWRGDNIDRQNVEFAAYGKHNMCGL